MRDLGMMGESTFSLWCAESGLIANGSKIDKTGWDFFVEFPFNFNADVNEIHKSAIECKVQIKATGGVGPNPRKFRERESCFKHLCLQRLFLIK